MLKTRKVYHEFHPGKNSSIDACYVSLPLEPWAEENEEPCVMDLHRQGLTSSEIADKLGYLTASSVRRLIQKRTR